MRDKREEQSSITVVVIRNGVAKEVQLPSDIIRVLEDAYEQEKVVGISQDTYNAMTELLANKIFRYHRLLAKSNDQQMYAKAIAFAQAFEIYSNESPILFDIMCWIDREVANNKRFTSRSINCRIVTSLVKSRNVDQHITYRSIMKDFKEWAHCLFSSSDLHVGLVKFAKFYYSVVA